MRRRFVRLMLTSVALTLLPLGHAQELVVAAASSLTEAFEAIARRFEASNRGVRVLLTFAGSSTLAQQILHGAPSDLFASANRTQMQRLADAGRLAGEAYDFAATPLVVITPAAGRVTALADLANPGVRLVLASPEVPVGDYARRVIANLAALHGPDYPAAVMANLASEEPNVRLVGAKVALGEADAAIVYATDAASFGGLVRLAIPVEQNVVARYPIAVMEGGRRADLARAFRAFVLSPEGQTILAEHGFGAP